MSRILEFLLDFHQASCDWNHMDHGCPDYDVLSAGKEQNRVQTEKRPDVDPGILYAVQWWYHSVVHHR